MSKIYTYIGKDNRVRYRGINEDGTRTHRSYPRILMEEKLGRPLEPNEDVHHIDGNTLNNDISNLEIVNHGEHQRIHSTKYLDTMEMCMVCGKCFTMNRKQWSRLYTDLNRGKQRFITCSKQCAGKASHPFTPKFSLQDRLTIVESFWKK